METQRRKQHNFTENNMWALLWHGLPVAALLLWGAFCITNSLWYDEAYSASMVSLPWKRLIYITATDDHSPFYYVLLKSFYHLCGGGNHFWALKLMSVLFMLGYMLLGKYYVAKLFDRKISVYFMLFSLLMPIFSVQAGNVRMYAVALFFLTLTGLSAYDIFREPARKKWIVFCIASIGTVYCHTFALIQTFLFYLLFFIAFHISMKYRGLICSAFLVILVGMVQIFAPAISSWQSPIGNVLSPFLIFYGDPVMLEFLFGILAYYLLRYLYRRHTLHPVSRTVSLVSAVCIPVIFCLLAYFTPRINVIGFLRLPQWGLPALLLLILAFLAGLQLSMPRFFVQLGNISYSLYLVHYYPVMFLDRVVFDFSTLSVLSVVGLIVSVVISIVLAYLCWILIERKFTGWLRRILLR